MSEFYVLEGKKAVEVDSLEGWAHRMPHVNRHVAVTEVVPS